MTVRTSTLSIHTDGLPKLVPTQLGDHLWIDIVDTMGNTSRSGAMIHITPQDRMTFAVIEAACHLFNTVMQLSPKRPQDNSLSNTSAEYDSHAPQT